MVASCLVFFLNLWIHDVICCSLCQDLLSGGLLKSVGTKSVTSLFIAFSPIEHWGVNVLSAVRNIVTFEPSTWKCVLPKLPHIIFCIPINYAPNIDWTLFTAMEAWSSVQRVSLSNMRSTGSTVGDNPILLCESNCWAAVEHTTLVVEQQSNIPQQLAI